MPADPPTPEDPPEKVPFVPPRWCVVANVSEEYVQADRRGKPHFAVGAKVYVVGNPHPGMDETFQVLARHRGSHDWVTFILKRRMLENWRIVLERSPSVLTRLRERAEQLPEDARIGGESDDEKAKCLDWAHYCGQQRLDWLLGRIQREHQETEA
jgi:hypothetical protein